MSAARSSTDLAVIVLAAGKGTRMHSARPKVLHEVAGRPMIGHVLAAVDALEPARRIVVIGAGMDELRGAVAPAQTAVQDPPRGTGDAARAGLEMLGEFAGDVLVLVGDIPLLGADTLRTLIARRRGDDDPACVVLGFRTSEPGRYGRLVDAGDGRLERIVEAKDASDAELAIELCNSGIMLFDGAALPGLLAGLQDANAQGEFYLTDTVALARDAGRTCAWVEGPAGELQGVDSRAALARAEAAMQDRLRAAHMEAGVTLADPQSVYFSHDTQIGADTAVGPHVVFGPGVRIEGGAEILAFSHIEGAKIAAGARIGPFARLRPGTEIGAGGRIGNFVETKNAKLGAGAKANHLAYLGDAIIGDAANIGAGTITCNYDGFAKHVTEIGEGAFIGSNSALVAPVSIGAGAIIGAGSTVNRDVADNTLTVARGEQRDIADGATRFRAARQPQKKG